MEINGKKIFMSPGKTNREDRENFVKFWAEFMKGVSDKEWSAQQAKFIDSQLEISKNFYKSLEKTEEGKKIIARLIKKQIRSLKMKPLSSV